MICKNCGIELEEGSVFCEACGTQLAQETVYEAPTGETAQALPSAGTAKRLGIAAMVCAIVALSRLLLSNIVAIPLPVFGLIIAAFIMVGVSNKKAKNGGFKKSGFALAGLIVAIVSAVVFVGTLVGNIGVAVLFAVLGILMCVVGIALPPMLIYGALYVVLGIIVLFSTVGSFVLY